MASADPSSHPDSHPDSDSSWLDRVRALWDERAPSWDEMSEANARTPGRAADVERTAAALGLRQGSRLLDAGCGTGQYAIAFAALGINVTAIDASPEMIARARGHAAEEERGVDVEWRVGDVARLAAPMAVFDAIHARVVLQFVADVPATLQELRRVLKPGGRLFASVPGALSPIYRRSWRRFFDTESIGTTFMVPWELEGVLTALGWTIVDEWGEHGQNLAGDQNPLSADAVAGLDRRLRQAAATSWTFIAR